MLEKDKITAIKKLEEIMGLSILIRREDSEDVFTECLRIQQIAAQVQALILGLEVKSD